MKKLALVVAFLFLAATPLAFAETTSSSQVTLYVFTNDPAVSKVVVSNVSSFSGSQTFTYNPSSPLVPWDLCSGISSCSDGVKTVYIKYLNSSGAILGTKNQSITLSETPAAAPAVLGCMDQVAQNFNPLANQNDGTCTYPAPAATQTPLVAGCTEPSALNFDKAASLNDGSCKYAQEMNISLSDVATAGAVAGGLMGLLGILFAGLSNSSVFSEIGFMPIRIFYGFMTLFGLKRRGKSWGIVYDSKTRQALDPVYVTLTESQTGKEVATALTDIEGRYGFLVPEGAYVVSAGKTHYQFPTTGEGYKGESFTIGSDGVVAKDIPLDPLGFDWNEYEKTKMGVVNWVTRYRGVFRVITSILFCIGLLTSLAAVIFFPSLINGVVFALNIIIGIIQFGIRRKRSFGVVSDAATNIPYGGIEIRFTLPENPSIIIKKVVTDARGRYYALLKGGNYVVTFVEKGEQGERVLGHDQVNAKSGMCDTDFMLTGVERQFPITPESVILST